MFKITNLLDFFFPRLMVSMGGGGGGGSGTGTQTQISELPEWARGYAKDTLEKGAALTEKPYQSYGGDRIAGFSPMQQQSQQGAEDMQTSGATGAGIGVAGQAAMRALGTNYQGGGYGNQFQAPGAYQTGQFNANQVDNQGLNQYQMGGPQQVRSQNFGSQAADDYMSPYMQNVVDVQQREAQRTADVAGTQRGAQAAKSGAFGGSRQAVMDAEAARNLSTQKGDIQAQGQQAAFTNAQQQFNADQARRMQAQQANQGAGLTTGQANLNALLGTQQFGAGQDLQAQLANQQYGLSAQQAAEQSRQFGAGQGLSAANSAAQYGQSANALNEQSKQFGAGQEMQGLSTALQGASTLGSLGGQQFQQGMDINKLQNAYGGQQQALRQQGLSQAYDDFQNQNNYGYKQLGFMSDLIRGLPLGQQTAKSMYEPNPSMAQNVGALGAGAYGLSKFMAEGGMAYADGGSVDSPDNVASIVHTLSDPDLQKAMQAAQARGDQDQLEAIQNELAMRASLKNGLASAVTPQMAAAGGLMDSYAGGGGVLAFDEGGTTSQQLLESKGDPAVYGDFGRFGMGELKRLKELKAFEGMTKAERKAANKEAYDEISQFGGEDPYAPMAEKIKNYEADRAKNYDRGLGFSALQAIPEILKGGNAARGIAGGLGAFGAGAEKADRANTADQRALAGMQFNLSDAQRKERMTTGREALANVKNTEANRLAAHTAERADIVAGITGAGKFAQAFRPVGGAGGAGKAPKLNERLYSDNVANMLATNKPKDGETDAQFNARINAAAGELTAKQVKDMGQVKADAAAATLTGAQNRKLADHMSVFMRSTTYTKAIKAGTADDVYNTEQARKQQELMGGIKPIVLSNAKGGIISPIKLD